MDSYTRFANDVLGPYPTLTARVAKEDVDEVRVALAKLVYDLDCVDNYRVYPLRMKKQYWEQADKGCCGSVDTQVKCLSGRVYLVGCNYGH